MWHLSSNQTSKKTSPQLEKTLLPGSSLHGQHKEEEVEPEKRRQKRSKQVRVVLSTKSLPSHPPQLGNQEDWEVKWYTIAYAWQLTHYDSLFIRTCFRIQSTLLFTATFFPSHCLRSTTRSWFFSRYHHLWLDHHLLIKWIQSKPTSSSGPAFTATRLSLLLPYLANLGFNSSCHVSVMGTSTEACLETLWASSASK